MASGFGCNSFWVLARCGPMVALAVGDERFQVFFGSFDGATGPLDVSPSNSSIPSPNLTLLTVALTTS